MSKDFYTSISKEELKSFIEDSVSEALGSTKPKESTNELLSIGEVCALLKVTRQTVHKWTKEGLIDGIKLGGRVLYVHSEVMNNLKNPKK